MVKLNLTETDIQDVLEQAKYEFKEYGNQPFMVTKKANIFIEKFKAEVTDKVWDEWCKWNDDEDDRTTLILNLFNEMYNNGELGIGY
jgi:hypothetical protein